MAPPSGVTASTVALTGPATEIRCPAPRGAPPEPCGRLLARTCLPAGAAVEIVCPRCHARHVFAGSTALAAVS